MFEKVNPSHPDKVADRIAGAIVDLCYTKSRNPKVACEVLIGHGECNIQVETSEQISAEDIDDIVRRIAGDGFQTYELIVPQDQNLAANQEQGVRCGDNGIFKAVPPTHEQKLLTAIAASIYGRWPYDGKYLVNSTEPIPSRALLSADENLELEVKMRRRCDIMEEMDELLTPIRTFNKEEEKRWNGLVDENNKIGKRLHELIEKEERIAREMRVLNFTICQSNAEEKEIRDFLSSQLSTLNYQLKVNPLGEWTGGLNTDSGATNRKLGSDMGDGVTGGGLMGKDLSKCDVSINIACFLKAVHSGRVVTAVCSIGDEEVTFTYTDGTQETERFADIVEQARLYILTDCNGSFERFAEWGLLRPLAQMKSEK